MVTHSLTFVYDCSDTAKDLPLVCMYRHHNGHLEVHGLELATFLSNITAFNGMKCLAAHLVSHFKTNNSDIYLYPISSDTCNNHRQEYAYHLYSNSIIAFCGGERMFKGTWANFLDKCSQAATVKD